jgi:hypothetical protein
MNRNGAKGAKKYSATKKLPSSTAGKVIRLAGKKEWAK